MRVLVNGEVQEVMEGSTVADLLQQLHVPPERVAVERNRLIVKRAALAEAALQANDEIEILTFVGGG
jgi:thiamine biosynthesis protein ThiS